MIGVMRDLLDRWRGSGSHAATVPPMDGVLAPNTVLEEAPVLIEVDAPDNLVAGSAGILFSSHGRLLGLEMQGAASRVAELAVFDAAISALAARGEAVAVGLDSGALRLRGGKHDGMVLGELDARRIVCPTALLFEDDDTLLVAQGSRTSAASMWRHDLMQKNASGSVWRCDLATGTATCLADGLAWPAGLLIGRDGAVIASEAWRNRLVSIQAGRQPVTTLADIAGYPGRIAPAGDGGAWLSVFAPRSQLVEFVLREDDYRLGMMVEIEPDFWVAPSLSPPRSSLEPMQLGGLKQLGILKPWAPTRSYGLVIGLDGAQEPRASFHSRADGRRHGVTSILEVGGRLLVTSKGGNAIVCVPLDGREDGR